MADANNTEKNAEKDDIKICKVCQTDFKDIYAYADHLESKEHMKGLMKKKYAQKYLDAKARLDEKSSNGNFKTEKDLQGSAENNADKKQKEKDSDGDNDSDEDDVYTCELCEKICTGLTNYQLHLSGSKHRKKMKGNKIMKELKKKKMVPDDYTAPDHSILNQLTSHNQFASSDMFCETCNVRCTGPAVFKQHCNGEAHKKKTAKLQLLEEMEADGVSVKSPTGEISGSYSCELCQKAFSGVVPYKQHLESLNHLKQQRDLQRLDKVKNLYITPPNSSKLVCKECHKTFSGPAPFEEHLRSSSHGKLKKKSVLYAELEKNHPEMVKTSIKIDSESEDSDDDTDKLACDICNMIFSGPEAAMDHFSSSKHKKTQKRKLRIEKHKRERKADLKESNTNGASSDDSFEKI